MATLPHRFDYRETVRYYDDLTPTTERESYYYAIPTIGVVEGWRRPTSTPDLFPSGYMGGIEVHSHTPLWNGHASLPACTVLGRDCYHDGSSLAFQEIEHYFDDPLVMRNVLRTWADANLNTEDD